MFGGRLKLDEDKGIVFSNRVRIGNWFESAKLEEYKLNIFLDQMKKGDLMLARYRKMTENLNKPTYLTQSTGPINFGAKVALLAPHVSASDPPKPDGEKGLLLGGRISSNDITYSQELEDGCHIVGLPDKTPTERCAFIVTSGDYCDRAATGEQLKYNQEFLLTLSASVEKKKVRHRLPDKTPTERCAFIVTSGDYCDRAATGEQLKYNQEFLLTLSASVEKKKPLYIRYDPSPVPGLFGMYPLYLSEHPVSNTRWRVLPKKRTDITRFEQEGLPVQVNTDVIINHCATNINLGFNLSQWALGFYGKVCSPAMKTCLDIYGRELPNNIWNFYVSIPDK